MLQTLTSDTLFEPDRQPPHYNGKVKALLNEELPDSVIGKGGPANWPARFPDLTPPDYFCGIC